MRRINPKVLVGAFVAVFFCLALSIRVFLPLDRVFSGGWIKFTSIDAYYHMRLVDNLVHNFPSLTNFDPFYIYPGGIGVGGAHFFDWLLSGIIWVVGLGSPTQDTVNMIGVYFPAFLAALAVIPVYFIGKALFNRWVGVVAAGLMAILPGEFLGRSILGFTDQHVAEALFSAVAVLFLILAVKEAGQRQLTFNHLIKRDWSKITRPLVYSLLAGIFLGIYLLTWLGGLLFVFIITLYFIIRFIINHLRHESSDHLGIVGFILFLVAIIIFLPFSLNRDLSLALIIALLVPLVLFGISRLMSGRGLKPAYYPLALVVIGIVLVVLFRVVDPDTLSVLLTKFKFVFFPAGAGATTTLERQPFLFPHGDFSFDVAWGNFTTSFFFSLIALLIMLIYIIIKRGKASNGLLLFFIWSLVILVATLVQRRFAYYFAINVALLTGYFSVLAYYFIRYIIDELRGRKTDYISWEILGLAGFEQLVTQPAPTQEKQEKGKTKREERRGAGFHPTIIQVSISIWLILAIFLLAFFPNIGLVSQALARSDDSDISFGGVWWRTCLVGLGATSATTAPYAPSDSWQASLSWMKENTPEPLGDPDAYYKIYEEPPPGKDYQYPESAYGVTSWWDYGYWITRTAHRLPSANPSQAAGPITQVAELFLSRDEAAAEAIMEELDSSYLIIDYDVVASKFWAIVTWAGQEQADFAGVYYMPDKEGDLLSLQLYYPEYYRLMCVRLYNFDGKAVDNEVPVVISYEEKVSEEGKRYRLINDVQDFSSYQEALDYVESQGPDNHRIVGANRFVSPIPLEPLQDYRLVYSSEYAVSLQGIVAIPEVKIFEYIK